MQRAKPGQALSFLTTAYGIFRHNGVEIGKRDFLGRA